LIRSPRPPLHLCAAAHTKSNPTWQAQHRTAKRPQSSNSSDARASERRARYLENAQARSGARQTIRS
jgi:hypothetical protein